MSQPAIIRVVPLTFSLGTAASAAGVNKSTIFRAIRNGKITATRTARGHWRIDAAELRRVYPPKPPQTRITDLHSEVVAHLQATITELRADRDAWREQAQSLARNNK